MTAAADRPYRRSVLRGTVATGVANGWAIVLGLVTLPLLLNQLGAAAFGLWVLIQTFSATSGWLSLGDVGLTTAGTRAVAAAHAVDEDARAARLAGTCLALFTALGAAWAALLALLGPVVLEPLFRVPERLQAEFATAVRWYAVVTLADFVIRGVLAVLEGAQRVDWSRGLEMTRRTLALGGPAVAALAGAGLAGVTAVSAAGTVAALLVTTVVLLRAPGVRVGLPALGEVGPLLRFGSSVAVLRPLGVLHRTMDRVVVGVVLGPSAVSVVEIATQLQNGSESVLSAASYGVTPSASWLDARGDHDRLRELVEVGSRYTLLATLPIVAVTALLAAPALTVWLGDGHGDVVAPAVLALAYTAVTAPLQVGSNLLVATGRIRPVLRAAAAGLCVNLALSIALVQALGVTGAFVATVVSAVVILPALGRPILASVDLDLRTFLATSVVPPVRATVLIALAVAGPVALPLPAVPTLVLGGLAALAAAGLAVPRTAMAPGELRDLLRGLRARTPVAA
ncbi:MAG TPA: lipopolysaccharide biosynthesis protein [Acidimicrobiales bacterium]|nr:lipopolysaccharide biosynthesis protein [Acidimicrobiales bacterium]